MKCEVKYIEHKIKKDYEALTIKRLIITFMISLTLGCLLTSFLNNFIINCLILIALVIALYVIWIDAVDYCNRRDIKPEVQELSKAGIQNNISPIDEE